MMDADDDLLGFIHVIRMLAGRDESEEDESEPDVAEGSAYQGEFSSNPETLAPIDFNSSVVTDAYQQQEGPGADLIGGQTNQRADSYQAQENQYAVLA